MYTVPFFYPDLYSLISKNIVFLAGFIEQPNNLRSVNFRFLFSLLSEVKTSIGIVICETHDSSVLRSLNVTKFLRCDVIEVFLQNHSFSMCVCLKY